MGQVEDEEGGVSRRTMLSRGASLAMAGGLAAGYGGLAAVAGRFLYPARPDETRWLFVAPVDELGVGASLVFRMPSGATAAIARQGAGTDPGAFVALSSTCPHLGCKVHWEAAKARFFCPCHNGVFDPTGKAIAGPPADAGQSLPRYPLKVENGLLFIEVPVGSLTAI